MFELDYFYCEYIQLFDKLVVFSEMQLIIISMQNGVLLDTVNLDDTYEDFQVCENEITINLSNGGTSQYVLY